MFRQDTTHSPEVLKDKGRYVLWPSTGRHAGCLLRHQAAQDGNIRQLFLATVRKAALFKIRTILTDNGKEFTDRLFGGRSRQPTGEHEFDQLCQSLGIEHRLTRPKTPQTNGMVERFNGRLSQVLRSHHFNSAEDLEKTLHRFVWLYNHHLPQKALGHVAPVQSLKTWKMKVPDLFVKNVRNHQGPDT